MSTFQAKMPRRSLFSRVAYMVLRQFRFSGRHNRSSWWLNQLVIAPLIGILFYVVMFLFGFGIDNTLDFMSIKDSDPNRAEVISNENGVQVSGADSGRKDMNTAPGAFNNITSEDLASIAERMRNDQLTLGDVFSAIGPIGGMVAYVVVQFAGSVKRLHDRNDSGFVLLIGIIPLIGTLYLLIVMGFLGGNKVPNAYGPPPLLNW